MDYPTYLIHYGIEGQKWGVRRFQNEDGTWASDGLERRKQLEKSGASKREIKKADRAGRYESIYNGRLGERQNKYNKKFDKVTEEMLKRRERGNMLSEKQIKKATKFGTEVRVSDYIAKDPQYYYKQQRLLLGAQQAAGLVGAAFASAIVNKNIKKHYADVYEKARNETIKDLKKHKLI